MSESSDTRVLNEISGKVGRLEALYEANARATGDMATNVNKLIDKLDKSDDVAKEALDKAKSAHYRLDKIDKIIFWAGTTVIGTVLVAIITFNMRS